MHQPISGLNYSPQLRSRKSPEATSQQHIKCSITARKHLVAQHAVCVCVYVHDGRIHAVFSPRPPNYAEHTYHTHINITYTHTHFYTRKLMGEHAADQPRFYSSRPFTLGSRKLFRGKNEPKLINRRTDIPCHSNWLSSICWTINIYSDLRMDDGPAACTSSIVYGCGYRRPSSTLSSSSHHHLQVCLVTNSCGCCCLFIACMLHVCVCVFGLFAPQEEERPWISTRDSFRA